MSQSDTKHCLECGKVFGRRLGYSKEQWAKSLYCSRGCSGAASKVKNAVKRRTLREAFEAKFERGDGCWEWQGLIEGYGYGVLDHNRMRYRAHVLALEFDGRPVPKGMLACHHCDNRKCVRPSHLYVGTHKSNIADARSRLRFARGITNSPTKLTEEDVRQLRRLSGVSYAEAGRMFGVSRPTATRAMKGITWRHIR